MNPTILCKTKKGNTYLYNFNLNQFVLVHPVMAYLLGLAKSGTNLEEWLEKCPAGGIEIENYGRFGREEIAYYYRKYLLFDRNHLFSEMEKGEKLSGRISKEDVSSILSNVNDVVFETTDGCNLNCKYCAFGEYYGNYDKREKKYLNFSLAQKMLDFLLTFWQSPLNRSHKAKINVGFYGGEPLMNIDLMKKVVDYSKRKELRNSFVFRLTTNALLVERNMDFLVENDFGMLISLDGDKESNGYRVFHDGSEAHEEILKNVMALKNKYPAYFERKVSFNTVLHNKNSVEGVYRYFKKNFDKIPLISEVSPIGIRHDKKEEFLNIYRNTEESLALAKDPLALEKEIFQKLPAIRGLCTVINQCSGCCFTDYSGLLYSTKDVKRIPTGTCLPFSKKLFLSVNGKIMPCERIGHQHCYGTVDEQGVHLDAEEVAQKANAYFDKIRHKCTTCYKADLCSVCIYNLKLDGAPEIKNCPEYMNNEGFSKYLASWLSKLEEHPEYYPRIMDEVYIS